MRSSVTRILLVFALFSSCVLVFAEPIEDPAKHSEIDAKIKSLESELTAQRQILQVSTEVADKRLADFATLATMQGSHTSWVGTLVSLVSILITVLVFASGFITYFNVKNRAVNEARQEAERWFAENAEQLSSEIKRLEEMVAAAVLSIAGHQAKVETDAAAAKRAIQEKLEESKRALEQKEASRRSDVDNVVGPSVSGNLSVSAESVDAEASRLSAEDLYAHATSLLNGGDVNGALESLDKALAASSEEPRQNVAKYMVAKGRALSTATEFNSARELFDLVVQSFGHDAADEVQLWAAFALASKAETYQKVGDHEAEIASYDAALSLIQERDGELLKGFTLAVLLQKASTYREAERIDDEIKIYDDVLRIYGKGQTEGVREKVARALVSKGVAYLRSSRHKEALGAFTQVEEIYGLETADVVVEEVAKALLFKTMAYSRMKQVDEELALYDTIARRFGEHHLAAIRDVAADSYVYKGLRLSSIGRFDDEIENYEEQDRKFGADEALEVRARVAEGLFQKAVTFGMKEEPELAIATFLEVDRRFGRDSLLQTQRIVANSLIRAASISRDIGSLPKALNLYTEVERRFAAETDEKLVEYAADASREKGATLAII